MDSLSPFLPGFGSSCGVAGTFVLGCEHRRSLKLLIVPVCTPVVPDPPRRLSQQPWLPTGLGRETVRALDVGVAILARPRTDRRDCVGAERLVGPQQFVLKVPLRPLEGLHGVLDVLFFFIMPGALGSWMSIWISGKVNRYIKGSAILNRKL
jgi:hypothetical protein